MDKNGRMSRQRARFCLSLVIDLVMGLVMGTPPSSIAAAFAEVGSHNSSKVSLSRWLTAEPGSCRNYYSRQATGAR